MMKRMNIKTKKLLAGFLVISLVFSVGTIKTFAETTSGTCGDNAVWEFDSTTGTLNISGSGEMAAYNYVDSTADAPATTDAPWSSLNKSVTSLVIESGITNISSYAFAYFTELTNITVPDGITSIGDKAFYNCYGFTEIALPDSITSLGIGVFDTCMSLKNITLPQNITKIPQSLFLDCDALKTITIPESVTEIGDNAFNNSGIERIVFPSSITKIGNKVLYYCTGLKSLTINCNTDYFNFYSNLNNSPRLEEIIISDNNETYKSIDNVVYSKDGNTIIFYPQGLTNETYNILEGTTTINNQAFYKSKVANIVIPDSVTTLNKYSINQCPNITDIILPSSVSSLDLGAIYAKTPLNSIAVFNPDCVINEDSRTLSASTIRGFSNSTAQTFAENNSITFENICADESVGHSFTNYVSNNDATCTQDGTKTAECDYGCTQTETITDTGSATGHSYTNYVSNNDATCTQDGTKTANCDNGCGVTDTIVDTGSAIGHNYIAAVTDPTCTEQGYTEYVCEGCADTYKSDYIDAKGHNFNDNNQYCLNGCGEVNPNHIEPTTEPATDTQEPETTEKETTEISTTKADYSNSVTKSDKNHTTATTAAEISTTKNYSLDDYSGSTETEYKNYRIVPCYNQIKVAWCSDSKLEGYEIYISTSKNSGFKKVADVKTNDKEYYIIDNLESKKIYYVKIIGYLTYYDEQIKMTESTVKAIMVK